MTLKDDMSDTCKELQLPNGIGSCVKQTIVNAAVDGRLKCGVIDCAALLKCNPDSVMLCVLPDANSENISINIQHTLIEAFCRENEIRILKVDGFSKMLVMPHYEKPVDNSSVASDLSCLLIEYPRESLSSSDEFVIQYHHKMEKRKHHSKPVIHIPK